MPLPEPEHRAENPSYASEFARALTNPEMAVPAAVTGPNGNAAVQRFNIYRNNVMVSLINALATIYPAVQRITGTEFFRAMARTHVLSSPPTSPLLFEYGRDFPVFIERYEHAQSMPWLADTAWIERAWLDAYHAADAEPLTPGVLAAIPPDKLAGLVFTPHPATHIVRSDHPAVQIFAMNRAAGPVGPIKTVVPEDALITRPGQEVVVRHLPPGGAIFFMKLIAGEPLGAAAAAAMDSVRAFDLSVNIAGMIEAGVFCAVCSGD